MKVKLNLSSTQWFILLWLTGFVGLGVIAGFFKLMMKLAY